VLEINRRGFLKLAGVGTAVAAGATIPAVEMLFGGHPGTIALRAVGGLPSEPLPTYASYVLDGNVDLAQKTAGAAASGHGPAPTKSSCCCSRGRSRLQLIGKKYEEGPP